MTKEISKEVRAKVFCLYYGCQVQKRNDCEDELSIFTFNSSYNIGAVVDDESVQLILSDLSDISDEDLIDVSRVAGLSDDEIDSFDNINEESKKAWAANIDDLLYPMADFLRSRGYMLPAHGITDLFEAGIAVRKNKEV